MRWLVLLGRLAMGGGLFLAMQACSSSESAPGNTGGGSGGASGTAGSGGGLDCTGTQPAAIVTLPQGYAIDATEVTRCQYQVWLDTNPTTAEQESYCTWNTDFKPSSSCMSGASVCKGAGCGKHPQVCVDWCDAYAYCKAVGKRLCGKIGGGSNYYSDYADASLSQWYNACVSDGTNNAYPYGNSYQAQACNGWSGSGCGSGTRTTVEVGSLQGCQSSVGGFAGVYDLSGNVWEWEDSCAGTADGSDRCRLRGGSFVCSFVGLGGDDYRRCVFDHHVLRYDMDGGVGFRCCSL